MNRLNDILARLIEIENEPFDQKKINEMAELNREKDAILVDYQKKYMKAYRLAGTNKEKVASFN